MHREIKNVPDGDVLVHAGDITRRGEIAVVDDFAHWLKELPHKYKIFIAGNHDFSLEWENDQKVEILKMFDECGLVYLQDSGIEIEKVYFYGSPATPIHHSKWAFNLPRDGKELAKKWEDIPEQTNVLITHGPPYRILDKVPSGVFGHAHAGCKILADRVWELPHLKAHIFGHIHEGYGMEEDYGRKFINSAICSNGKHSAYKANNLPHVFEI